MFNKLNIFSFLLAIGLIAFYPCTIAMNGAGITNGVEFPFGAGQRPAGLPELPQLSEEQANRLEQELQRMEQMTPQELEQELFSSIEKLPADQQKAIWETMEKLEELEKESPELLQDFIEGRMNDQELEEFLKKVAPDSLKPEEAPIPEAPIEEQKIEESKPVVTSKQEQARQLIEAIINRTNSFIVKISAIPELAGSIEQWKKKGKLDWAKTISWNTLKNDIDILVKKLQQIIELDPLAKGYKYLENLVADEALYNNLNKFKEVLNTYEPQIEEASPFGLEKMSTQSKEAIQKMLNQYNEALYLLKIPEALDKLFVAYEPKAEKAREKEKKAQEKAAEEAKKPRVPGRTVTAGRPVEENDYDSYDFGFDDYSYKPYRPPYTSPSYAPTTRKGFDTRGPESKKPSTPPSTPTKKPTLTKDAVKPDAEKAPKISEDKKDKEKVVQPPKVQEDKTITKLIDKVSNNLDEVASAIQANKHFLNIRDHLLGSNPVDMDLATFHLPEVIRKLGRKGTLDNISTLKMKVGPKSKAFYKKRLQKLYDKHKKVLDKFEQDIKSIQTDWDTIKSQISIEKQYAYFGIGKTSVLEGPLSELPAEVKTMLKAASPQEIEQLLHMIPEEDREEARTQLPILTKQLKEEEQEPVALKKIKRQIPSPSSLYDVLSGIQEVKKSINEFVQ